MYNGGTFCIHKSYIHKIDFLNRKGKLRGSRGRDRFDRPPLLLRTWYVELYGIHKWIQSVDFILYHNTVTNPTVFPHQTLIKLREWMTHWELFHPLFRTSSYLSLSLVVFLEFSNGIQLILLTLIKSFPCTIYSVYFNFFNEVLLLLL